MRPISILIAAALAVALTACGDDGDDLADEPTPDAEAEAPATGDADLALATTDLGEVLVDGDGMTLYLFTVDPPGESACEDDCAAAWPPLIVDADPVAGDGVDASLIGTTERSDGSTQVTYADAPLYRWASDREPGDVTGQGVQDVWYVVTADGEAVTDAPADTGDDDETEAANEIGY
ncbi:COG4315 family predicted lipoprotein [Nitriliruptor alkaliphilus]|uniref:COG4315 family predicted lipoprotein n=1 Tax=Nitriliruptor alkaliphilus TaxID=427918 RepID=UPI000697ADFF|nr:hypothetical protein [Nitriliruptor alkaliphilus]